MTVAKRKEMKLEADPEQQVITTWQVHTDDQYVLPGMLAKSFVGQSFARPRCPPAQVEVLHQFRCHVKVQVLHLFRCFTHTRQERIFEEIRQELSPVTCKPA